MMERERREIGSRIFLLRLRGASIDDVCRVLDMPRGDYIPFLFAFLQAPTTKQAELLKSLSKNFITVY